MASLDAEFDLLLQSFDQDPSTFSRTLRSLSASNPVCFVAHARRALLTVPACRALKCLAGLLTQEGLLQFLLEQYAYSRPGAIQLARKILQVEPRFDAALIEYVEDKDLIEHSERTVLCALDILDEISERDRLVLNILTFLKHPNPKLRSKAARMLGKRRPNASCIDNLVHEADARVRANAVESLFDARNDYSYNLFRVLSKDANNRVAGNARLGLYLSGDTSSIGLIDELACDDRPNFRNTGAWVMSQTADARFVSVLGKLMTDPSETVRAQAFRALARIKTALKGSSEKAPAEIAILHQAKREDEHSLSVAIYDQFGQPLKDIPGTRFSIRMDGEYVRSYSVRQHDCANALNIAFVLCLPKEDEQSASPGFEDAVERCLRVRRPTDRWAVLKVTRNLANRQNTQG
jgi:HEAT repeats